ncbi:mannose-6-phosphate isomerase, partial [Streptomyces beijiangensis]|nr:mannose-6-phosphate isomerase [Streptomyces beijiangensis]
MLDETLLDTPDALARADRLGLLRGAAEAGARVRTAARHAVEAGIAELKPEGRPRALLLAGPGTAASGVADLITALAGPTVPVTRLGPSGVASAAGALRWALPGWAGPVDLLLITTTDGTEPGLALLAEQA